MLRILCAIILTVTLIGCGGGGGGSSASSGIDPRLQRLAAYEAQNLGVLGADGMAVTQSADMPDSGALSFAGNATIRVEDGANTIALFGDAEIAFDFGAGTGQGRMHRFFGNDASGDLVDFAGEIAVGSNTAGQDLALDYQGMLTSAGDALAFDGTMQGMFLGTPVAGFVGADLEAGIDRNGQGRNGSVIIVATTNDAPAAP